MAKRSNYSLSTPDDILRQLEYAISLAHQSKDEMPKARLIVASCKHAAQVHALKLMREQLDQSGLRLERGVQYLAHQR